MDGLQDEWRPRLAEAAEIRRTSRGLLLAAPGGRAYCELAPHTEPWLEALDGTHTIAELTERFGPDLATLVDELHTDGYLTDSPPASTRRVTVTGQGVEVAGAARLVEAIYPMARPLLSPPAVAVLIILGALGMVSPLIGWLDLDVRYVGSPLATAVALLGISFAIGVLHELGHAVVLAHYGRAIGRVGAGFYWGDLSFYVDASAAIMLPKRARMWQAAAGVIVEAALAGALVIIAQTLPDGPARTLMLQTAALSVLGVLLNATPLLRLDGYWFLADALDIPDLYRYAGSVLRDRNAPRAHQLLLGTYIVLGAAFGIALLVAATFVWIDLFGRLILALWVDGWLSRIVAIWLLLPLAGIIIQPLARLPHALRHKAAPSPTR